MFQRGTITALTVLSLVALALAGCSSGGNSTAGAGGGSTGSGGGSSGSSGSAATATFSGDISGTVSMNLCTDSGADSITVLVKGDSQKYLGSVSATGLGFLGPDGHAFARDLGKSTVMPKAISGEPGGYSVDGVQAFYELPGDTPQSITFSGKLVCP